MPASLRTLALAAACPLLAGGALAQATVSGAAVLELPGGAAFDSFGRQVLVHGDQLIVTANGVDAMGAAFAFREVGGVWTQEQKFRGGDTGPGDFFGYAAAREGDVLVLGAHQHDLSGPNAGAAYVFERQGGTWAEVAKLAAPSPASFESFGWSVDVAGELIVVGASGNSAGGPAAGAVYVHRRAGGTWILEQVLSGSTTDAGDEFGWRVSTDGTAIAVAAVGDEQGPDRTGAVFVFEHNGQTWQESARLVPPDVDDQDRFGWDLDLEGGTLVASATNHDHPLVDGGAVYVYEDSVAGWSLAQELVPSKLAGFHAFGWSLDLHGTGLAVGAGTSAAAYWFHHDGTRWVEVLQCTDPVLVGGSCSTDGARLVVGNPWSSALQGSAYLFDTSDLGLDAVPDAVPPAGSLALETYGGLAGAQAGLYALSIGGVPSLRRVGTGVFDAAGKSVFTLQAPLAYAGLDLTVVAAGLWANGAPGVSNPVTVTFQ